MSNDTQEFVQTFEQLPLAMLVEVADFARFLLAQQADERREQIMADPKPRAKLDEFLNASKAEGSQPLGVDRL